MPRAAAGAAGERISTGGARAAAGPAGRHRPDAASNAARQAAPAQVPPPCHACHLSQRSQLALPAQGLPSQPDSSPACHRQADMPDTC